jgi:hypothetical protein
MQIDNCFFYYGFDIFITLFFPWSVNIYKTYFGINEHTFGSVKIFLQLLWTVILPVVIPIAIVMPIIGGYIISTLMDSKRRTSLFNLK